MSEIGQGVTRWRKRPVVVSAMLWDGSVPGATAVIDWILANGGTARYHDDPAALSIDTLEGTMIAPPGSWVIRGVAGEFYRCHPGIFERTYEPAGRPGADTGRQVRSGSEMGEPMTWLDEAKRAAAAAYSVAGDWTDVVRAVDRLVGDRDMRIEIPVAVAPVSPDLSCARCAPADSVADHPDDCRCGGCEDARTAAIEDGEDDAFAADAASLDSDFKDDPWDNSGRAATQDIL